MKRISRDNLIDAAFITGIILAACLALYLLIYFLLPGAGGVFKAIILVLAPFIIAWLVAILTKPLIKFFNQKLRFPKGLAVLFVMLCLFLLIAGVFTLVISRVVVEISSRTGSLSDFGILIGDAFTYVQDLLIKLDFHIEDLSILQEWLMTQWENISSIISSVVSSAAGGAVTVIQSTPTVLLFIIVTFVAIYFWSKDDDKIKNALVHLAPQKTQGRFFRIYDKLEHIIGEYCRAQFILVAISMLICIVAFNIMGVDGAFTIGLLTGVLDVLPVLGPGTIVIPWSIIAFVNGNTFLGIGMLVLYVVLIVTRNIIEPKLLGDRLGLHPLATLAAIFIGYQLLGFWGLVLGPITLAIVFAVVRSVKTLD